MRTFLKILFQAVAGLALIYGLPGVAAVLSQLGQSSHSRLWQAALAIALVAGILWWNLGKPRIRIRGIPWRGLLYFPGAIRINPASSAFNNTAYVNFMNATHGEDEDAVARDVVAKVRLYTPDWKLAHEFDGAWVGPNARGRSVDFYPGDAHALHVAISVGDRLHVVDHHSFRYPAERLTNAGPELKEDHYMVRVRLIGQKVNRTFWFQLSNFAKNPNICGFYTAGPLPRLSCWYFLKLLPWLEEQSAKVRAQKRQKS